MIAIMRLNFKIQITMNNDDELKKIAKLKLLINTLNRTEIVIINWLFIPKNLVENTSIKEIADTLNVSKSLIVKIAKKLGCSGFKELKKLLLNYFQTNDYQQLNITEENPFNNIIKNVEFSLITSIKETISLINEKKISEVVKLLLEKEKILLFGVGGSYPICLDFNHKLLRLGIYSETYNDFHLMSLASTHLNSNSLIIVISTSGNSLELISSIEIAKKNKSTIIGITSNINSKLQKLSDLILYSPVFKDPLQGHNGLARICQLFILDIIYLMLVQNNPNLLLRNLNHTIESNSATHKQYMNKKNP